MFLRTTLLALVLSLTGTLGWAQEDVTFQASPIEPTAFKVKRAKKQGIDLKATPGIELRGKFFASSKEGPSPAVVLLVSADGMRPSHLDWAQRFAEAGYATLIVDSYGARGGETSLDVQMVDFNDDAVSGHRYLASRPDIDPNRIAIIGFSLGGAHIMSVTNEATARVPEGFNPFAAIALYPICPPDGVNKWPLLILAGEEDHMISVASCTQHVEFTQGQSHPAELQTFAGATHFFDNPEYGADGVFGDLGFEYSADTHQAAVTRVLDFLASI